MKCLRDFIVSKSLTDVLFSRRLCFLTVSASGNGFSFPGAFA